MHPLGSRFAAATAITLLALTACSSDPAPEPTATTVATESAEPAETTPSFPAPLSVDELGGKNVELGIIPTGPSSDIHGDYTATTLSPDSPLFVWSGETDPALEPFGPEAVQDAVETASSFLIEAGIDQPMLFDDSPEAVAKHDEQVFSRIDPAWTDIAREEFAEKGQSFLSQSWMAPWFRDNGFSPVYDGGVRYSMLDATLESVSLAPETDDIIRVGYKLSFAVPMIHDESGEPFVAVVWVLQAYGVNPGVPGKVGGWAQRTGMWTMNLDDYKALREDGTLPEGLTPENSTELEYFDGGE